MAHERRRGQARLAGGALALLAILALPAARAGIVPLRVLAPALAGVTCVTERLCVEEEASYEEAAALYDEALAFVGERVGALEEPPRVIFCRTARCFGRFGLSRPAAHAFGAWGIVVGPRGWRPHYLRHEMIHHLQAERLGAWRLSRAPAWFREGMAYALSEDPRPRLAPPLEEQRAQFEAWYRAGGRERLWEGAGGGGSTCLPTW